MLNSNKINVAVYSCPCIKPMDKKALIKKILDYKDRVKYVLDDKSFDESVELLKHISTEEYYELFFKAYDKGIICVSW